jgi:hypothetical protein
MIYRTYWILADNIRVSGKVALKGEPITLPEDNNTLALLNSGVLSDVKPKVIYNKVTTDVLPTAPTVEKPEEVIPKPSSRRKRNDRKSSKRTSDLRVPPETVSEGLPGTEQAD